MNIIRFDDVSAFYERVEPYLLPQEAVHNLSFGLLGTIRTDPTRSDQPLYRLVEQAGVIQLVAIRTSPERSLILSLAASPEAVAALAESLRGEGVKLNGVNGPDAESRSFAESWSRLNGIGYHVNVPMRTFKLEKVNPVVGVQGYLRRATADDRDLLVQWFLDFSREAFPNQEHDREDMERNIDYRLKSQTAGTCVWEDGSVVSLTGYGGPTPSGIRIGPVYTPPELRGRGYASALVAGVSQMLLDSGYKFCFLFTDLRNPTSNHIYQVIGYEPVCDFTEYLFE